MRSLWNNLLNISNVIRFDHSLEEFHNASRRSHTDFVERSALSLKRLSYQTHHLRRRLHGQLQKGQLGLPVHFLVARRARRGEGHLHACFGTFQRERQRLDQLVAFRYAKDILGQDKITLSFTLWHGRRELLQQLHDPESNVGEALIARHFD